MNFFFRKWSAISRRIRSLLFRNAANSSALAPALAEPAAHIAPAKRERSKVNTEIRNFKASILDSLDEYFFYLKRMKAGDPTGYRIMTKVGGCLWKDSPRIEPSVLLSGTQLEPIWEHSRPSFHYGFFPTQHNKADKDKLYFVIASFNKIKGFAHILPLPKHDVYEVCLVYDRKNDRKLKRPVFVQFSVGVEKGGTSVKLLKSIVDNPLTIESKRGPKHARGQFVVRRQKWGYPSALCSIAEDNKSTPEEMGIFLFCLLANGYAFSGNSMISITAERKGLCAKFSIDPSESKVFFEDRDLVLNQKGKKAKIFHSVRAHSRTNGSAVRFHFKGIRSFEWNGYKISIRIPGKDAGRIFDFDATQFSDESKEIAGKKTLTIDEFIPTLARDAA